MSQLLRAAEKYAQALWDELRPAIGAHTKQGSQMTRRPRQLASCKTLATDAYNRDPLPRSATRHQLEKTFTTLHEPLLPPAALADGLDRRARADRHRGPRQLLDRRRGVPIITNGPRHVALIFTS